MSILFITSFVLITIIVILGLSYYIGIWDTPIIEEENVQNMIDLYKIPSAWTPSLGVEGASCQVYTFNTETGKVPQPSLYSLNSQSLTNKKYTITPISGNCIDDDQIFAKKVFHVCRYGELGNIPISQYNGCKLTNGGTTKIDGYYEEFFELCSEDIDSSGIGANSTLASDNSQRCLGSIGLISYNLTTSLHNATCILEPEYKMDGENVIIDTDAPLRIAQSVITPGNPPSIEGGCSISDVEVSLPSQLFRVVQYDVDNSGVLKQQDKGPWISIGHRPTGLFISPYTITADGETLSLSSLKIDRNPILVEGSSYDNENGVWFYTTPRLSQPPKYVRDEVKPPGWTLENAGDPTYDQGYNPDSDIYDGLIWRDQLLSALPQIIWAPDTADIVLLKNDEDMWNYFTDPKNKIYSMVPFGLDVNLAPDFTKGLTLVPFLTYNPGSPDDPSTILSPNDPTSQYFPNMSILTSDGGYLDMNKANPDSACYNYSKRQLPNLPFTWQNDEGEYISQIQDCFKEYSLYLIDQYNTEIETANERLSAENGSFQFLNLDLYSIITNSAESFGI